MKLLIFNCEKKSNNFQNVRILFYIQLRQSFAKETFSYDEHLKS